MNGRDGSGELEIHYHSSYMYNAMHLLLLFRCLLYIYNAIS